jgi:hypothetical protein
MLPWAAVEREPDEPDAGDEEPNRSPPETAPIWKGCLVRATRRPASSLLAFWCLWSS